MESGFRSRKSSETARAKENVQLFQIKGTSELNTRAVEVGSQKVLTFLRFCFNRHLLPKRHASYLVDTSRINNQSSDNQGKFQHGVLYVMFTVKNCPITCNSFVIISYSYYDYYCRRFLF